jgi:hypothetical protein
MERVEMNDRKLLELAAKAAGLEIVNMETKDCLAIKTNYCNHDYWNPLTDDGDALRLVVKLNLFLFHAWTHAEGVPLANVMVQNAEQTVTCGEIKGDNPCAATRRAIVRAAAEIGKGV